MACPLAAERIWVEKSRYHDAEKEYYERLAKIQNNTTYNYKLLKGTVSATQIDNPPSNVNSVKSKYRTRKIVRKSKSPEIMAENGEAVDSMLKSTPNTSVARSKKQKKSKGADSEASSTNSAQNDISTNISREEISQNIVAVEETKTKKKKKKKTNKDAAEKLQDISQKENVPPTTSSIAAKKDSQESNDKPKSSKNKGSSGNQCTLVSEIAKARQHIKNSLEKMDGIATLAASPASPDVLDRLAAVEKDNADLRKLIEGLKNVCIQSENRVKSLEQKLAAVNVGKPTVSVKPVAPSTQNEAADDDDGVDLFASDSEEEESAEAAKIREERLAAYAAKKSKKPVLIAKSSVVLDVKPWDDETNMPALEAQVRKINLEGLLWGASKYVPVAFGIKKLSISCVVEDDKVSVDGLIEEIEKIEEYVQSVDVAAFNKI